MINTICYKTKNPIVYNAGTPYEKTESFFLSYFSYAPRAEVEAEAERLNTEKPKQLWNGQKIDWDKIDYFYADAQEMFF